MGILNSFLAFHKDMQFELNSAGDILEYINRRKLSAKSSNKRIQEVINVILGEIDRKNQKNCKKGFYFTDKQKEFFKMCNRRWNVKIGATRSGKTYLDYFLIPKRIMNCRGEGLIVILGNTQGTVNRNIIEPMKKIWGDNVIGKISADGTIKMFGKTVYILGADKISSVQKIQGAGIEYCYGDEITTWNEEVFQMLKSRLDKPNSLFDGTCNPDAPGHWFKKFLESDADIYQQHYNIYDNEHLTKEFVKSLENEYRGTVYFKRFILGEWAMAEGVVYPMFTKENNVLEGFTLPDTGEFYISMDYGTLNPCSMGLWYIDRANRRAIRIKEYYYDGRDKHKTLTDEEYYNELCSLAGEKVIQSVIIDPSAASFIATIRKHGRFNVKKAKNSVLDGIRKVSVELSKKRIMICSECENTIKEFGQYVWDEKANEDKVIKANDHAMDDIRYFVNTVLDKVF